MGITQHTSGTENVMAVANLAMLTGNIGRPGTGVNPLRGQNNVQGACDMGALPNVFPAYQQVANDELRAKVASAWGIKELPSKPGLTVVEMMEAASEKKLKAMYIMGENPMVSDPDLKHVEHSLKQLELLIVQDIFLTETGKLAQVILPSACFAEKEGTFTNTERRVQRLRKAVEPPGEAKADSEIICRLAEKMGMGNLFTFSNSEEIFEEIRKVTPSYAGMTYERLNTPQGLQWPCPNVEHPGIPILHKEQFTRGKGLFKPALYKKPAEVVDQEFPLTLTTGRVIFQYHTGSMSRRSPNLESEVPEGYVEINPLDARSLGLREGELVEVESRRGRIETKTKISRKIKPGIVFIPFHFAERAANMLTNPALDPISKIPEYKACAVRIKKII
jgi:formate dehydrogenase major subunit